MHALKGRPDDETTFRYAAVDAFDRGACRVQNWIDEPGPFPPEPGRYHVFVNYGCGWCHQLLLVLRLRGLHGAGGVGVTHSGCRRVGQRGTAEYKGFLLLPEADTTGMLRFTGMADVYNAGPCTATGPGEASRGVVGGYGTEQLTVPVLFDVASRTVVSNDPAQMLLMLDFWADRLRGPGGVDVLGGRSLYPEALRDEIEMVNATVYPGVNNGVYCCWFTKDEHSPAFQEGFGLVQRALTWLNARLAEKTYLCGDHVSLADVRAFPHLYRFDCIYYQLMLREKGLRIFSGDEPLPHLARWLRDTMLGPGAEHSAAVRESCDLQVATRFYFSSLPSEEADALYDRRNAEASGIFPSREEWVAKRQKEGFIEPEQVTGHNG